MAAQRFILTQTPVQILDGTKAAYIQEIRGEGARYTCTTISPDTSTTPYCTVLKNDISVSNGFPIWAWTPTAQPIEITVLTSEIY